MNQKEEKTGMYPKKITPNILNCQGFYVLFILMNPVIENITQWFYKMEVMEQKVEKLTEKVIYLENQLKNVNSNQTNKSDLMTIKDITKEYRISRTSFYFIREKQNISPTGFKGKIMLYDRNEIEKSIIRKVG